MFTGHYEHSNHGRRLKFIQGPWLEGSVHSLFTPERILMLLTLKLLSRANGHLPSENVWFRLKQNYTYSF